MSGLLSEKDVWVYGRFTISVIGFQL
jgi:hypothetical protein